MDEASPMTPNIFKDGTEKLFQTLYAGLTLSQTLLQNGAPPRISSGELSTAVTRIYVATTVAHTIIGVLVPVVICTVGLFIYAYLYSSILQAEPFILIENPEYLYRSLVVHFPEETRCSCYAQ